MPEGAVFVLKPGKRLFDPRLKTECLKQRCFFDVFFRYFCSNHRMSNPGKTTFFNIFENFKTVKNGDFSCFLPGKSNLSGLVLIY